MNVRLAALLSLQLAAPLAAWAGPSGSAFLKIPSSARSFALGRSHVISALGSEAMGGNPANIGVMPKAFELTSSFVRVTEGVSYGHMAAAFAPRLKSFEALEGVAVSVTRLQVAGLDRADEAGARTGGSFDASDMQLALGACVGVTGSLGAGAAVKFVQSQIGAYRSSPGLLADLGLRYSPGLRAKPASFGLSLNNLGQGTKFLEQRDPPPTSLNLGAALPVSSFLGVVQLRRLIQDQRTELGAGLEMGLGTIAFRVGYHNDLPVGRGAGQPSQGSFMEGLAGGIGLRVGGARVDYAMSQQASELGPAHRLSVTLRWGAKEGARLAKRWKRDPERMSWYSAPIEWSIP